MKRTFIIAAAALAVAALAGPSTALAGKSHLLGVYKVEKHLDLQGEDGEYTISCDGTDIAVDGMWRIDNVDQDNDYVYGSGPLSSSPWNPAWDVLNSVEVVEAYASSDSTYRFKFIPQSGGDVQGKLFLFCLPRDTTQAAGHQHPWSLRAQATSALPGPVPANGNSSCLAGEIAVQPGFQTTGGGWHLYRRWPGGTLDRPTSWSMSLVPGDGTVGAVNDSWSCLKLKSGPYPLTSPNHAHRIVTKWRPANHPLTTVNRTIPANAVNEQRVHCGEHYKGALGAFSTSTPYTVWYLGMDPRPKTRAFKVLNSTLGTGSMDFGALCFKDRTT